MRRLLLLTALLSVVPSLTAQSTADREKALERLKLMMIVDHGCPVAVSTQRRAPYTMVETGQAGPAPRNGYLYMHFMPRVSADGTNKNQSIVAATITLHGTDGAPRTELATTEHSGDLIESFNLGNGTSVLFDGQVSPKTVVNVRWLSIAELRYADGTVWHPAGTAFCHITPNGFELVNATAK